VKKYKKTLTVISILVVAVIMFTSFFGIYKKNENGEKMSLLADYNLGMEFENSKVITMDVSQEIIETIYDAEGNEIVEKEEGVEYTEEAGYKIVGEPVNPDSVKTQENYRKTKKIITERLKKCGVSEFLVELDENTGKIKIQIPDDSNAEEVESIIKSSGSLMLMDGQTFDLVYDSSNLDKATVMYSQGELETAVFLQLEFNENGKNKLNELLTAYATPEQTEGEEEVTEKTVIVLLNNQFLGSVAPANIVYDNKIMLTLGVSNDNAELQKAAKEAEKHAVLLNTGSIALEYEYGEETKDPEISQRQLLTALGAAGAIFLIAYVLLVIKFKAKGFISVYFQVGFLAILLLVLRLTNVLINMEGIIGITISMILDLIFTYIILTNIEKEEEKVYNISAKEFFIKTIPFLVIAIVCTFATRAYISSFGETLFWGILMIYVYNFVFSKFVFENLTKASK